MTHEFIFGCRRYANCSKRRNQVNCFMENKGAPHLLNIPRNIFGIRAHKYCEWYFTQMLIFIDADYYEKP